MGEETTALVPESPLDKLTVRERAAYKRSVEAREPFLSGTLSDDLYRLYQSGRTTDEIQALNPKLSLGIIVRARIDHGWDGRRQAYLEAILFRARGQAQQLSLESLEFIGSLLTAIHRHDRDKLSRFIQTGDASELSQTLTVSTGGLKIYKGVLELLLQMTGQGGDSKKKDPVLPPASGQIVDAVVEDSPDRMTPAQAKKLLMGWSDSK